MTCLSKTHRCCRRPAASGQQAVAGGQAGSIYLMRERESIMGEGVPGRAQVRPPSVCAGSGPGQTSSVPCSVKLLVIGSEGVAGSMGRTGVTWSHTPMTPRVRRIAFWL